MSEAAKQVVVRPVTGAPARPVAPHPAGPARVTALAPSRATIVPPVSPTPVVSVQVPTATQETPAVPSVSDPVVSKPVYRFAKLWGVAEVIRFKDGSTFQFQPVKRNNAPGFDPTSSVETEDEKLAANLRAAAKTNRSIREVPSK